VSALAGGAEFHYCVGILAVTRHRVRGSVKDIEHYVRVEVSTAFGPVSGLLRVLRGSLLGLVMVFAGVVGHVSAGGLLPSAGWLASLAAVNLAVALVLAGRPIPIRYLVLLVVGGQAFIHIALTLTAGHVGETFGPPIQFVDGHFLVALQWQHLLADFSAHAPMMMAHVMAATTVAMWLGVGERALWALIAAAHARVVHPLILLRASLAGLTVPAYGSLLSICESVVVRPQTDVLSRTVVRRGPPFLLAA
jgi:hypothetical protein